MIGDRMTNFLRNYIFLFSILLFFISNAFAQDDITISGVVVDESNEPLAGVNIQVVGTVKGTTTDDTGVFKIRVIDSKEMTLNFSFIGYFSIEETYFKSTNDVLIVLKEDLFTSEDVVIVGSRFRPRTVITSPVPVDNIKVRELKGTAQVSLDKMLHYVVPSFNSTQQTISDATAHFDPADLRGLGPSRTLVLINGKRKSPSALVFINDTPGKGDVGVDMSSIPVSAIKRVEVLRDGASAQYGSDAIAGVINIVLNDETEHTSINSYSGITQEGDGFQFGANANTGVKIGERGFLNVSAGYSDHEETNRAGEPGNDLLILGGTNEWTQANKDLGMKVGLPNMTSSNVYYNAEIDLEDNSKVYSFGGLVYRSGTSYALYRAPYWVPDPNFIHHNEGTTYDGFHPTFETDIFDAQWTTGFSSTKMGWNYDLSYSYGNNTVDYKVSNSLNPAMNELSPTVFYPGGYEFNNNILNFDISKQMSDQLFVSIGTEYRLENFITNEGDEASYTGGGAQSFPGLQPQNAINAKRTNVGAYLDLGYDATDNLFFGGAIRLENYSDFGNSTTYKVNGRLKTSDNRYSVRGAFSSGFRAPSLHQIYLSNIQTLVSGGTVSNQGTFNNDSPILRKLGVDKLTEEKATNFTLGVAGRPMDGLTFSIDFFQINVDDRIVYSSSIASSDTTSTVGRILQQNSITSLKFFLNAVNTSTQGVDFVARYHLDNLRLNAAASFYEHSIEGSIDTPDVLAADGLNIFDRKEQSRLLSARPTQKIIAGASYDFNPFTIGLSGTYFGEVTWKHENDAAKDQTFSAKTIFDLNLNYKMNEVVSFGLMVNNLLDTYPDVIDTKGDIVTDLGGRFKYPWEVNQFGFNGRVIIGTANFNL